jgi:hypothetical protein
VHILGPTPGGRLLLMLSFIKFVAAVFAVIFINGHDIPPYLQVFNVKISSIRLFRKSYRLIVHRKGVLEMEHIAELMKECIIEKKPVKEEVNRFRYF